MPLVVQLNNDIRSSALAALVAAASCSGGVDFPAEVTCRANSVKTHASGHAGVKADFVAVSSRVY